MCYSPMKRLHRCLHGQMIVKTIEKARGMGENISFAEQDAAPELLIKKARTEILIAGTKVDVNWENITYQHDLLGQSTTYQARADNASLWRSFNLNGEPALLPSGLTQNSSGS